MANEANGSSPFIFRGISMESWLQWQFDSVLNCGQSKRSQYKEEGRFLQRNNTWIQG